MNQHVSLATALSTLSKENAEFKTQFAHGTLLVELYKPQLTDKQQPHNRDEVYIIASGNAIFHLSGEETAVQTGDFLFVPAGAEHRFVQFSAGFSTWVLFYGPVGGEAAHLSVSTSDAP